MKTKGDTSPIRVRKKENGRYEVEEGHRRLRAHMKNGDKRIDCILGNEQERADIIDSIVMSNLTTRNLTPLEMAKAMQLWVEESLNLVTWVKKKPLTEESVRAIADNIKKEDVDDLKKIRNVIEKIINVKLQDTEE